MSDVRCPMSDTHATLMSVLIVTVSATSDIGHRTSHINAHISPVSGGITNVVSVTLRGFVVVPQDTVNLSVRTV